MFFGKKKWDPAGKVRREDTRLRILPDPRTALRRDRWLCGARARACRPPRQARCPRLHRRAQPRTSRKGSQRGRGAPTHTHSRTHPNDPPQTARQSPEQILRAYSYGVDSAKEAEAALDAVAQPHNGRCSDALFLCADKSRPGFWIEQTEAQLRECMDETYWVQAWPALVRTLVLRCHRVLTSPYRRRQNAWSRKA